MSKKTRTISWMEGKVLEVLSKKRVITTYLALTSCVLRNVRSIDEQHNLDIAVARLLSRKEIIKENDCDGFTVFKFVA